MIAAAPAVKKEQAKVPEPVVSEPMPALQNDDIRGTEGMLALPGDGDFRATNPAITKPPGGSGTVVSRPPTDPPSRVKPKSPEPE